MPTWYSSSASQVFARKVVAISAPARFARLVLIGPSPRYLDDRDYVGGFSRGDIDGLLEALDSNYLGWSSTMASTTTSRRCR